MKFLPVAFLLGLGAIGVFAVEFTPTNELPPGFELERHLSWGPAPHSGEETFVPEWKLNHENRFYVADAPDDTAQAVYGEGMPVLPVQVRTFQIPAGMQGVVELEDWAVSRSGARAPVAVAPREKIWSPDPEWEFPPEIHDRTFPGKLYQAKQVGNTLVVQWFPLQWDRRTGELWQFEKVHWRVNYTAGTQRILVTPYRSASSLIFTTRDLVDGARALRDFHRRELSIQSEILLVESIAEQEKPVDEATLPPGYKDFKDQSGVEIIPWDGKKKVGYNYDLARKLIAFLRRRMGPEASLQYVTLLGDSSRIPPSYYYGMRSAFGSKYTPTDACYGAEDKCMAPSLAVGRLPFTSNAQVTRYLTKAREWLREAPTAPRELALYGGKAFQGTHFIGELGTVRVLDYAGPGWRNAVKYHRTAGNYTKNGMTALARGDSDAAFVYHLDHGLGNRWYVESDYVTSTEIEAMKDTAQGLTPWVASISCVNGAFDDALVTSAGFGPSSQGKHSIGVALLRSPAGAVGYLGSARPAIGQPLYEVDDKGNLEVKATSYGLRLLDTFYLHYNNELGGRVGDRWLQALRSYTLLQGHDMSQTRHQWTYFNAVMLGDPTLRMPARRETDPVLASALSETVFDVTGWGIPSFNMGQETYSLAVQGPQAEGSLLKVERSHEKLLGRFPVQGATEHQMDGNEAEGTYLLKLENTDGVPREKRVWFRIKGEARDLSEVTDRVPEGADDAA